MKHYEMTSTLLGIATPDEFVDGNDASSTPIRVERTFSYGSKFDGDDFLMETTQGELEKLIGMSARDIIYVDGDLENCKYKPGHSCHVCGKFLFGKENLHGDSCAEVFSFMMEQMVEIGKIFDRNGAHNFNCCEACIEKHLKKFIIENDVF